MEIIGTNTIGQDQIYRYSKVLQGNSEQSKAKR